MKKLTGLLFILQLFFYGYINGQNDPELCIISENNQETSLYNGNCVTYLSWSNMAGQLLDKFKLYFSLTLGLAVKVILKFSGDPPKEVSGINFGNNFGSGLIFFIFICLCN